MTKLRVLLLEDDMVSPGVPAHDRLPAFHKRFRECRDIFAIDLAVDHVYDAADAVSLLKRNEYWLVLLDHDLDGQAYVKTTEANCGTFVAHQLASNRLRARHRHVVVHSLNREAALGMVSLIQGARYAPWVWQREPFHSLIGEILKHEELQ